MKIRFFLLLQSVSLSVFKKLLLPLKPYLLGECEGVLILLPLFLVTRSVKF